jgi:hypothetical protein
VLTFLAFVWSPLFYLNFFALLPIKRATASGKLAAAETLRRCLMSEDTTVSKWGEIRYEEKRGKVKVWAQNREREGEVNIGSLIDQVFEKEARILERPEPSFTLSPDELDVIQTCGAIYLRVLPKGRPGSYVISLADFKKHAEPYRNAYYGFQHRVALRFFQSSSARGKRNPIIDNPPLEHSDPLFLRTTPADYQLGLFGSHGISPTVASNRHPRRGG